MTLSASLSVTPQFKSKNNWSFKRRSFIPLKPDVLWKIESGVVRTSSWHEDGNLVILGLWGPGDIVGQALTRVQPYQMECLTSVKAISVPTTDSYQFTEMFLSHIQQLEELAFIRSHKRIEPMLMSLLTWLAQKFGRVAATGQLIDLRLTHQELSEILGSTRVTITRAINQLEQQGVIERYPLHRIVLREEEVWHYEI
ncbi:Crp/Fnr family transcriptional regulator [Gloeothece verrucosa]|uniref:Putative transcriptional regulator, Crp/Fnr family n=1 Tax=Gloeothece verrucosa (strain PCC 7822) TaxID=497965 RepID=E0U6D2_GLOV7|nr:Crp/Fnr family transcriptional regulator [Gloeothece verrucosa]ADN13575.1 putative transcriptional regulator, Crp/Fnr family [Gloeothece verrucosa PCC 7822]